MKRLNPENSMPFKHGDIREDGFVFICYNTKRVKSNGFFTECWKSPESYIKANLREAKQNRDIKHTVSKLLKNAKARAKKYGGTVTITKEWLERRLVAGISELSGLPFILNATDNIYSPSVDRRDSKNRDYTPENCRMILWGENQALNSNTDEEMLPILEAMVEAIKNAKA